MPVAFSAEAAGAGSSSSWERSRPVLDLVGAEDFLVADLLFLGAARAEARVFSSSASRASFSAFLRARSEALASAASLCGWRG